MKIDIHTHTKKTKQGDAQTRNISPEKFVEIIKNTDVGIVAITNHNHFDKTQYDEICSLANGEFQIWPGVELDIVEDNRHGHLLVIVSPDNARQLNEKIEKLLKDTSEDRFEISILETINEFDELNPIYIPHYFSKKPDLTDEDIEILYNNIKHKNRLIKEATNSISAGIYVSHGHKSIYGSDIHDWDNYIEESKKLPELRLEVENFNRFCLLLEKDESTINTILDKKKYDEITLKPFENEDKITIPIYNDINVIFGSKGTGKSKILEAIAKHYEREGMTATVYQSSKENLDDEFEINEKTIYFNLSEYDLDDCKEDITLLKSLSEKSITNLSKYVKHFESELKNKKAQKILVKDIPIEDNNKVLRDIENISSVETKFSTFSNYIEKELIVEEILEKDLTDRFKSIMIEIEGFIKNKLESKYVDAKSSEFVNTLVSCVNTEITRKTGHPSKPLKTGFEEYASNRIQIERISNKLINAIEKEIPSSNCYVGDLGAKGSLYCKTEFVIQNGNISKGEFSTVSGINKTPIKSFVKKILEIKENIYTDTLFDKILDLNNIEGIDEIDSLNDLVLFQKYFILNENRYKPSNGEASMLLLHKELREEKDIYLLDEPEKSLGNDYINDIIVPIFKEKAKLGKSLVIATHDANIAVRTLPYNSIYRRHEVNNYTTFIGNPFSNKLLNTESTSNLLDWKAISMKTLEGGMEAFGERGKIYGNKESSYK